MSTPIRTYLSLGSNQGNKLEWLQKATDLIFENIGRVVAVSTVYKTPAWGFDGADFFNACLAVSTRLSAERLLAELLRIENQLGRVRDQTVSTYQNRNIDLDILFYGDAVQSTANLQVPHPKMTERKFVLAPLADIAANKMHPEKKVSVADLLNTCTDKAPIASISERLKKPTLGFSNRHYISIEGNIGAGKTSLSTMIAEDFNAKLILEGYKDNPFLPKFYEDPSRYAFPLEMSFLAERYQQMAEGVAQYNLFADFVISDYELSKSLVFAGITLQEDEFLLYKRLFNMMHKSMTKPDLYVYLYQNTARLLENIKKRGRSYESNIAPEYLEKINRGYMDFIKAQAGWNVRIIDVSNLDFVYERKDYVKVLHDIFA